MFQNLKNRDILTVVVLLFIVSVFGYFYANSQARSQLWLKTYPVRAELATRQISCSEGSPSWLANIITYQVQHNNAPANQVAYIDPQGSLHHCENGYIGKYPLLSAPNTEQTRFRYASVTKLWTSDAILSLIKEDRLSLDTKLVEILTEINAPKDLRVNEITIGQLLLHRAGFDRYSIFGNDMFNIGTSVCPNNLAGLNDIYLGFDPDSKASYSNLGYCLLGEVISRLNEDKPYTEIMAQQYKFSDTSLQFISNSALPDEVSYNYVETGLIGVANIYTQFDYDGLASSAGLSGNAIDLVTQVRAMVNESVPNILSLDTETICDVSQLRDCYGYAMFPYRPNEQSETVYYRDGNLLGLSSLVAVSEQDGVVALLSNGTPNHSLDDDVKMKLYRYLTAE